MRIYRTGGPAFPRAASVDPRSGTLPDGDDFVEHQDGMSLRDWFAGQALMGYLAAHAGEDVSLPRASQVAEDCYVYAAKMLAEREKVFALDARTANDLAAAREREAEAEAEADQLREEQAGAERAEVTRALRRADGGKEGDV